MNSIKAYCCAIASLLERSAALLTLLRLELHMGNDLAARKIDDGNFRPCRLIEMDREPVAVERHGGDSGPCRYRQVDADVTRRGGDLRGRNASDLCWARSLVDNGREHEGDTTDQQHPHHDDRDLEEPHLTGREDRPRQCGS